ncbi:membrane associated guanylate kinase, WW and PDZ [Trichuris trichiura]|uniref:Membrane associated guanylate kinase, WW and PDZ n=1 Tax=Trichuris trichiura TaxID=36087 RepID=A0A077Z874_TRITR|nr:membrane associated guanylate kinase, WW and PDZ [Trichuris trichiura]
MPSLSQSSLPAPNVSTSMDGSLIVADELGPLPPNWEVGYTDIGEKYFIDHNTDLDLPFGWEMVDDPQYGVYYVDHVNKKTQYERPEPPIDSTSDNASVALGKLPSVTSLLARTSALGKYFSVRTSVSLSSVTSMETCRVESRADSEVQPFAGPNKSLFTRDPTELRGEMVTAVLVKGHKGLGFTLVGSDGTSRGQEFLQIKSVLPGGPAYKDGRLRMGDVLVFVNDTCVLGYSQDEVIRVFQLISVGQQVTLQVCRGYPLLFDPCDPSTDFVTQNAYLHIVKGDMGFGFTIADSPYGQKVKKVLDRPRCHGLLEGDILCQVNGRDVRRLNHAAIVDVLRDCPVGRQVAMVVQSGITSQVDTSRPEHPVGHLFASLPRSKTPGAAPPKPAKPNAQNGGRTRTPSSSYFASATPNYVPATVYSNLAYDYVTVNLLRHPTGFGFRLLGGTEEGSHVRVGQLVPGGAASQDGRLRFNDEIVEIDGQCILNCGHQEAVDLMSDASRRGRVKLVVRRPRTEFPRSISMPLSSSDVRAYPFDVTVVRRENEGFGFVIISSVNRAGSAIGRIINGSPAARCGRLRVGDRILAVNGIGILKMPHGDIVNLIKDSGYAVTLTVGSPDGGRFVFVTFFLLRGHLCPYPSSYYMPILLTLSLSLLFATPPPPSNDEYFAVELQRGSKGFGFSIRGGREFSSMPLFVLRIAEGGPADLDRRLQVGDQLLEINGVSTTNMTHSEAIELIKREPFVRLLVRRQLQLSGICYANLNSHLLLLFFCFSA